MDLPYAPAGAAMRLALPPPPALAGLLHHFHIEYASAGRVVVPASPLAQLTFFIEGGSLLPAEHGQQGQQRQQRLLNQAFVCGPMSRAMPAEWQPGTTFVSALIEPSRFAGLFGLPLNLLLNLPVPLDDAIPGLPYGALQERLLATRNAARWVELMSDWLLRLAARREDALRAAFRLPAALLFCPAETIALQHGISVRQFERRFLAAYGQNLRDSRRLARYARALAMMMSGPQPLPRGQLTRIAMDAGYHDQAHMVRDFSGLLGQAPGGLMAGPDTGELRLLRYDADSRPAVVQGW